MYQIDAWAKYYSAGFKIPVDLNLSTIDSNSSLLFTVTPPCASIQSQVLAEDFYSLE